MTRARTAKQRVLKLCPRAYAEQTSGGLWKVYQGGRGYNDWLATADAPGLAWKAANKKLRPVRRSKRTVQP